MAGSIALRACLQPLDAHVFSEPGSQYFTSVSAEWGPSAWAALNKKVLINGFLAFLPIKVISAMVERSPLQLCRNGRREFGVLDFRRYQDIDGDNNPDGESWFGLTYPKEQYIISHSPWKRMWLTTNPDYVRETSPAAIGFFVVSKQHDEGACRDGVTKGSISLAGRQCSCEGTYNVWRCICFSSSM